MKKTRVLKSWSKRNLPEELWAEILSWLPVKSLLRFRCVSKSWKSMIVDPDFTRLHLNRFRNNRNKTHLFVVQGRPWVRDCVVKCSSTFKTTARLGSLITKGGCFNAITIAPALAHVKRWKVVSSIDGLVMLENICCDMPERELMLWNPSIRKARGLTPLPEISNEMKYIDMSFGFDPFSKDYKHVRFVKLGENSLHSIAIYSLGTDSWKKIQFQGKQCSTWCWSFNYMRGCGTICSSGCLYFIEKNLDSNILELVSFNLSSEKFSCTCLPVNHDVGYSNYFLYQKLAAVDDRCSLVVFEGSTQGSVWVLEISRTDAESMYWNKLYSFTTPIPGIIYLKMNGDVLLNDRKKVVKYNLETHNEKLLHRSCPNIHEVYDYIESLILLK